MPSGGPWPRRDDFPQTGLAMKKPLFQGAYALGGSRTCNLRFRRPMLYPVELQVHLSNVMNIGLKSPEVNAVALYIGMKLVVNAGKAELIRVMTVWQFVPIGMIFKLRP